KRASRTSVSSRTRKPSAPPNPARADPEQGERFMAMAGVGGAPGSYKSDINITPLVDVVLVLLIIFMVITPLLQMGYDVKVPPKATVDTPPPSLDQLIV